MASAISPSHWLTAEESEIRCAYWQYLVKHWLWQAPFAVVPHAVKVKERAWDAPSQEALQDFGYVMVPESQGSH